MLQRSGLEIQKSFQLYITGCYLSKAIHSSLQSIIKRRFLIHQRQYAAHKTTPQNLRANKSLTLAPQREVNPVPPVPPIVTLKMPSAVPTAC